MDSSANAPADQYGFGLFRLEARERRLWRDGELLALQPKVFDTLVLLVANAGRLMTKEALMAALWPDAVVEESNLTKNVWSIRKALGDSDGGGLYIETIPRVGYRFVAPVRVGPEKEPAATRAEAMPAVKPTPAEAAPAPVGIPTAPVAPPPTSHTTRLGPYEILAPIGAGGMGEVYRARDPRLNREVAIKVLPKSLAQDPERLRRFEQEARSASAINHPGITAVHDFGSHEGSPYIVTELLEGETLRLRLAAGPLPPRKAIDYAIAARGGPRRRSRKGGRPSRRETGERFRDQRRPGQDPGLRSGQVDARRSGR